jgi:hypothetical protein
MSFLTIGMNCNESCMKVSKTKIKSIYLKNFNNWHVTKKLRANFKIPVQMCAAKFTTDKKLNMLGVNQRLKSNKTDKARSKRKDKKLRLI